MLVTTATSRASFRKERSDSSASRTAHSPPPHAALVPSARSSPPIRKAGSRPASASASAVIEAVVVFPWVPATAIDRLSLLTSPSRSPRWRIRAPAARALRSSGLSSPIAVDTTTSASCGGGSSCPARGSMPASLSRAE